jgi:gluconokinase
MVRIVVMGVAGAGKSTVGRAVAGQLRMPFVDADDLHSEADRARMASGEPLDDARRDIWIERVRDAMEQQDDVVVACSALRHAHRRRLQSVDAVEIFLLDVPADELARRLGTRSSHFFPVRLLASQLASLDPPQSEEGIVVINGDRPASVVADHIVAAVRDAPTASSGT